MRRLLLTLTLVLAIGVAVAVVHRWAWRGATDPLVVYCAHDARFSERIIREFERRSGLRVDLNLDNELTKSLALTERLIAERDRPRCDVFWNNQLLGTADLAERGLLEPYRGPGWQRIGARHRDPEGRYAGFAARLRVYIVNTERLGAQPDAVAALLAGDDLSALAFARPLWGTTLTHHVVLWDRWGPERLKSWRRDLLDRGAVEAASNGAVTNLVAEGHCALGMTDTDDFFVARDAGRPVAMLPVRLDDGAVICIPNTVAIIKGTRRLAAARRLVDFLLSAEVELMLAKSSARQIPLGPVEAAALPEEVRRLRAWSVDACDLADLVAARGAALAWLKSELLD